MSRHRLRVERGLYRDGSTYYACATPAVSRSARWKSLGAIGVMEARRLCDESSPTSDEDASLRPLRLRAAARVGAPLILAFAPAGLVWGLDGRLARNRPRVRWPS